MRRTSDEKRPSHILGEGRWKSSAAQLNCERGKHLLQTSYIGKFMACRTLGLTNFHVSFGPSRGVFGQGFDYSRRFFMPKSARRKIGRQLSCARPAWVGGAATGQSLRNRETRIAREILPTFASYSEP